MADLAANCLARLTNWDKTSFRIDSCFTVSHIVLCKRKVSVSGVSGVSGVSSVSSVSGVPGVPGVSGVPPVLCDECLKRPTEGKYHSRIIHGLLTEPIPITSSIYGGPIYWAKMKKFKDAGKLLSDEAKAWIAKAAAAQDAAEAIGGWKVQRLSDKSIEMVKARAAAVKSQAAAVKAKAAAAKAGLAQKELPKSIFTPVEVRFRETEKLPVRLETDSMMIRQEVIDGVSVWVAENGMRFEDVKGEIGELVSL